MADKSIVEKKSQFALIVVIAASVLLVNFADDFIVHCIQYQINPFFICNYFEKVVNVSAIEQIYQTSNPTNVPASVADTSEPDSNAAVSPPKITSKVLKKCRARALSDSTSLEDVSPGTESADSHRSVSSYSSKSKSSAPKSKYVFKKCKAKVSLPHGSTSDAFVTSTTFESVDNNKPHQREHEKSLTPSRHVGSMKAVIHQTTLSKVHWFSEHHEECFIGQKSTIHDKCSHFTKSSLHPTPSSNIHLHSKHHDECFLGHHELKNEKTSTHHPTENPATDIYERCGKVMLQFHSEFYDKCHTKQQRNKQHLVSPSQTKLPTKTDNSVKTEKSGSETKECNRFLCKLRKTIRKTHNKFKKNSLYRMTVENIKRVFKFTQNKDTTREKVPTKEKHSKLEGQ